MERDDHADRIVSNTPKELRLIARVSRLPWGDGERVNFTLKGLHRLPRACTPMEPGHRANVVGQSFLLTPSC